MPRLTTYILSLNCGSSSLKFALYHSKSIKLEISGAINRIGEKDGELQIKSNSNQILEKSSKSYKDMEMAAKEVADWINNNKYSLAGIGHRLVQGGPDHRQPELITDKLLEAIGEFIYLAPNHMPDEIKTIGIFKQAFKDLPQVACFDTSFHRDMPFYSKYYPLPSEFKDKGLIRYGFHGLSYEYIMQELKKKISGINNEKIIIAHLGNGASMAAVKNGSCVETTMGVSTIGGLIMGTRSGDLDPGVLLFLMKQTKLTVSELDDILSKKSGLKGVAGISDVQELLENELANENAKNALTMFCYTAKKFIGSLAAAMGGVDRLVFTGGIGENSAVIRQRICQDLKFLGIETDEKLNEDASEVISNKKGKVIINVQQTNEEWMIAQHTLNIIKHR